MKDRNDLSNWLHGMSPQVRTLAEHLINIGTISGLEARSLYRIEALPRRVSDLEVVIMGAGLPYTIERTNRKDPTGKRYVRYRLVRQSAERTAFTERDVPLPRFLTRAAA
ncbi:hypothetical protein KAJ83_01660 [Marivibrio halodurans]|uniref:Winged helix-turn-helix domain-containing protein n=1 Tax=Marivibrio halodurans TaxID=2039722 RepID=A0A8J7S2W2_9PROT|nr:helix-turn-helix domain-containing protein [Marivibrio halodurans]MBP5855699.1 hypothetical protein [Marivibrio halodurans]